MLHACVPSKAPHSSSNAHSVLFHLKPSISKSLCCGWKFTFPAAIGSFGFCLSPFLLIWITGVKCQDTVRANPFWEGLMRKPWSQTKLFLDILQFFEKEEVGAWVRVWSCDKTGSSGILVLPAANHHSSLGKNFSLALLSHSSLSGRKPSPMYESYGKESLHCSLGNCEPNLSALKIAQLIIGMFLGVDVRIGA